MNGVDVIVFGGGIGENSYLVREAILSDLDYLGIKLDKAKNKRMSREGFISPAESKIVICVVNVDEELVIARETYRLVRGVNLKIKGNNRFD